MSEQVVHSRGTNDARARHVRNHIFRRAGSVGTAALFAMLVLLLSSTFVVRAEIPPITASLLPVAITARHTDATVNLSISSSNNNLSFALLPCGIGAEVSMLQVNPAQYHLPGMGTHIFSVQLNGFVGVTKLILNVTDGFTHIAKPVPLMVFEPTSGDSGSTVLCDPQPGQSKASLSSAGIAHEPHAVAVVAGGRENECVAGKAVLCGETCVDLADGYNCTYEHSRVAQLVGDVLRFSDGHVELAILPTTMPTTYLQTPQWANDTVQFNAAKSPAHILGGIDGSSPAKRAKALNIGHLCMMGVFEDGHVEASPSCPVCAGTNTVPEQSLQLFPAGISRCKSGTMHYMCQYTNGTVVTWGINGYRQCGYTGANRQWFDPHVAYTAAQAANIVDFELDWWSSVLFSDGKMESFGRFHGTAAPNSASPRVPANTDGDPIIDLVMNHQTKAQAMLHSSGKITAAGNNGVGQLAYSTFRSCSASCVMTIENTIYNSTSGVVKLFKDSLSRGTGPDDGLIVLLANGRIEVGGNLATNLFADPPASGTGYPPRQYTTVPTDVVSRIVQIDVYYGTVRILFDDGHVIGYGAALLNSPLRQGSCAGVAPDGPFALFRMQAPEWSPVWSACPTCARERIC